MSIIEQQGRQTDEGPPFFLNPRKKQKGTLLHVLSPLINAEYNLINHVYVVSLRQTGS
jgi:hypothetical protein